MVSNRVAMASKATVSKATVSNRAATASKATARAIADELHCGV